MKAFYTSVFLIGSVMALLLSCHRRPLEEEFIRKARIPIGAEWTQADIVPQNVTVLFYNQYNGRLVLEHRFEHNDNRIQSYAAVPVGRYTVVLFNELRGQIRGVGIRGYENLSTLEAYALPNPNIQSPKNGMGYVYEPEILASVLVPDLEVSYEMADYTSHPKGKGGNQALDASVEKLVGVVPLRKVHEFKIAAHVRGLINARMPALVDLKGVAESYSFSEDRATVTPAIQQFTMNNRVYDIESKRDGSISATIHTFGLRDENPSATDIQSEYPVSTDFFFLLMDVEKTLVRQSVDVTGKIKAEAEGHGAAKLSLNLKLPEPLPDVDPQGEDDSGFGSELIDWDTIDVPLKTK